jgi:hypothetical protein
MEPDVKTRDQQFVHNSVFPTAVSRGPRTNNAELRIDLSLSEDLSEDLSEGNRIAKPRGRGGFLFVCLAVVVAVVVAAGDSGGCGSGGKTQDSLEVPDG